MSVLETRARFAWRAWGAYGKATLCSACRRMRYCRARRNGPPWLCLECFDVDPPRSARR